MASQDMDPRKNPSFALAAGFFRANQLVRDFVRTRVRVWVPAELAKDEQGAVLYGQLLRVDAWLRTLGKLDDPADFQAVAAAARGMLETTIDMVLLHTRPADFQTLLDWEESARFKHAQCIATYYRDQPVPPPSEAENTAIAYANANRDRIERLRAEHGWLRGDKPVHVDRWTSCDLLHDAREADGFGLGFQFERYYETTYRQLCWMVHGSAFAMRGVGPEGFAGIAGMIFPQCSDLGLAASEVVLRHFDRWGAEQELAFKELKSLRTVTTAVVRSAMLGEPPL